MNTVLKKLHLIAFGSALILTSCSSDERHPDYKRVEGKWKEVRSTANGVSESLKDTWYEFNEDLTFESYTGKGYTYKLDTAKHVMKAFGTSAPESGVNKKEFEVSMFEKDYRFSGDTLVLGVVSKIDGKRMESFYIKQKEE